MRSSFSVLRAALPSGFYESNSNDMYRFRYCGGWAGTNHLAGRSVEYIKEAVIGMLFTTVERKRQPEQRLHESGAGCAAGLWKNSLKH